MKKLILLLLFIPLVSIGQTYDEFMSINSLDTYMKVVIENDYQRNEDNDDWVSYGTNEIFSSYNTTDKRYSFQIAMFLNKNFNIKSNSQKIYKSISNSIKRDGKYNGVKNYKTDDYVTYKINNSIYGFSVIDDIGIIRYFPPNAPTQD